MKTYYFWPRRVCGIKRFVNLYLIMTSMLLGSSSLWAQSINPTLILKVTNCLNAADNNATLMPCEVSNLERIELTILLKNNGNSTVVPLRAEMVNPDFSTGPRYTYILLKAGTEDGATVPVKASVHGGHLEVGEEVLEVSLQIPEYINTRQSKLQAVIDQAKTQAQGDPAAVREIEEDGHFARDYLDEGYVQNRLGRLQIVCEFHSTQPGAWNGTVSSAPLAINVLNKGEALSGLFPSTPTLTAFTPASGHSGTAVTLTGSNFTGATAVRFGRLNASAFTVDSPTRISAFPPAVSSDRSTNAADAGSGGGAFTAKISVTTPAGTATSADNFSVVPPPFDPPPLDL